jgi:G:T-mismatch repair DNA endonuclease (very short patch repair protein)
MLRQLGWSVLTVWECQLKKPQRIQARLENVMAAKGDPKKRIDKFGEKPRQSRINQAD